jgi:hypothetical protein
LGSKCRAFHLSGLRAYQAPDPSLVIVDNILVGRLFAKNQAGRGWLQQCYLLCQNSGERKSVAAPAITVTPETTNRATTPILLMTPESR